MIPFASSAGSPPRACGAGRRAWLAGAGRIGLGLAGTLTLGACSAEPAPEPPTAAPLPTLPPPRVAWVFGSGGPRGFVHVGVLRALAELGLRPDLVVGASAGALVGTLFAAGLDAQRIEALALDLQAWTLLRWQPFGEERWHGDAIAGWTRRLVDDRPLQALPVPTVCAAQRLADGEVVGFSRGDAGLAVQAATAIEGQFAPVTIGGLRYADADLRMPLPVRLARASGAARVLAVDASAHAHHAPPGSERYRETDRRKRELTEPDARLADLLLHPDIGYWAGMSREYRQRVIEIGYRDTLAAAPRLRALHAGG
jgi:NTE family protein